MERDGAELLGGSGAGPGEITHTRTADIRYAGQGHEISVPIPDGALSDDRLPAVRAEFDRVYRTLYGREGPPVELEALAWRVVSRGPLPASVGAPPQDSAGGAEAALKGERPAYFPSLGGFAPTPVYDRRRLGAGASLAGPAIIEERESTAVIGPGGRVRVDGRLNLVAAVGGAEAGGGGAGR